MNVNVRKVAVGLVVLGVIVLAYVTYMRFGSHPPLDFDTDKLVPDVAREAIDDVSGTSVGTVGGVGIRTIEQTSFFHTDANGDVDREFGFDELIHSDEDRWEITNPYMRLFLGDLRCRVTADRGRVELETADTALGQPMPSDAEFTGNVVIRIIPSEPNDPKALFIYLDDVAFLADQSLFSTTGKVKFVSRSAQLVGRGMDLLYDDAARQLRWFRVRDLESLRLRSEEFGTLDDARQRDEESAAPAETPEKPVETAAHTVTPTDPNTPPAAVGAGVYECIFFSNVTITTPGESITARDRFAIHNILWSDSEPNEAGAETVAPDPNAPAEVEVAADPNDTASPAFPGTRALDTRPSESLELEAIPESFFDVVVTCDNGFVIAPKGSPRLIPDPNEWNLIAARRMADGKEPPVEPVVDPNRQVAIAQRIEFDATSTDTTLSGPVTLTFALDANDLTGRDSDKGHAPVTITAQDSVRYIAAAERIELNGNCAVTLQQTEPNYTYEYMLTAPRLALDLMEDPNAAPDDIGITLRRFVALGGPVAVHAQRKAGADLVGWVELKATQFDFQSQRQEFVVSGPGIISLHNGEDIDVGADPNEFSIGQPCFALMQNFDTLTYSALTNLIVADADDQMIQLDYIPEIDGSYDHEEDVRAYAGRIEIALAQIAEDRFDLASIAARRGIEFVDSENEFQGAELFYDHAQDLITVTGDADQSCYLNGALVDRIEVNPKTGRIKTELQEPSMIPLRP